MKWCNYLDKWCSDMDIIDIEEIIGCDGECDCCDECEDKK